MTVVRYTAPVLSLAALAFQPILILGGVEQSLWSIWAASALAGASMMAWVLTVKHVREMGLARDRIDTILRELQATQAMIERVNDQPR